MGDKGLVEILTRAVIHRGIRRLAWSHTVPAKGAIQILGVQIGSAAVDLRYGNGVPVCDVWADCDLWYTEEQKTCTLRTVARFCGILLDEDEFPVADGEEISISLAGEPRTAYAEIEEGQVVLTLEADVAYEVIGPHRFWTRQYQADGPERAEVRVASAEPPPPKLPRRRSVITPVISRFGMG